MCKLVEKEERGKEFRKVKGKERKRDGEKRNDRIGVWYLLLY